MKKADGRKRGELSLLREGGDGVQSRARWTGCRQVAQGFPIIGKIFSNHWKIAEFFFQSLENFAVFSNGWKKSFQSLEKKFPIIGKFAVGMKKAGRSVRLEDGCPIRI